MKNFESVYKEPENLFIKQLPDYIEKVNKAHNGGIILKPFENTTLEEYCLRTPCFKFKLENTEYSEKDRIIENSCFTVCFEILFPLPVENKIILYNTRTTLVCKKCCMLCVVLDFIHKT